MWRSGAIGRATSSDSARRHARERRCEFSSALVQRHEIRESASDLRRLAVVGLAVALEFDLECFVEELVLQIFGAIVDRFDLCVAA